MLVNKLAVKVSRLTTLPRLMVNRVRSVHVLEQLQLEGQELFRQLVERENSTQRTTIRNEICSCLKFNYLLNYFR